MTNDNRTELVDAPDPVSFGLAVVDELDLAEVTKNNYRRSWRFFCEWSADNGVDPLDAEWHHVLSFLRSGRIGGLLVARKAIGHVYHACGMPSPAADRRVGFALGTRQAAGQEHLTDARRDAIARAQADYEGWCNRRGLAPSPASGEQVVAFLESLGDRASEAMVRTANVAVSFYQMERDCRATEHHPAVTEMLRARSARIASADGTVAYRNERPGGIVARHRRHWEAWRDSERIAPGAAIPCDVVRYLRTVEHQKVAGTRLYHLRKSFPSESAFRSGEVCQWLVEFRARLAAGQVEGVVFRNRTRSVLDEWEADAAALASADVRVPPGLTLEEVTRRRKWDASPRVSREMLEVYALAWAEFTEWLNERGIALEQVEEETVRVFLEVKADKNRVGPLRNKLNGVAYGFGRKGFANRANPAMGDDPAFYLQDLELERKEAPSQVDPIREAEYSLIKDTAMVPRMGERESAAEIRGAIIIALVRLMFDGLLRGIDARRAKWSHICEHAADGSAALLIPHSKTDKRGRGDLAYISPKGMDNLAFMRDLMRFYRRAEWPDRHIFTSNRSVMRKMIREAALDAGLVGTYAGHSMRVGGAQQLAMAGFSLPMIMLAGRWSDPAMVKMYIRGIAVQDSAMAKLQRMLHNGQHRLGPEARGVDVMSCYNALKSVL